MKQEQEKFPQQESKVTGSMRIADPVATSGVSQSFSKIPRGVHVHALTGAYAEMKFVSALLLASLESPS